jgi:outer membrane protein assembly factor BamB
MTYRQPAAVPEPRHAVVQFPGAIRAAFRWAGSGQSGAVFALSEVGGDLTDYGSLVSADPDRLCRAELRVESPAGTWSARLASTIFDDPVGAFWDEHSLLLVGYGFTTYAFAARTGELRWSHRAKTPLVALLVSSRLPHVLVQTELETFAIRPDGEVAWRVAHSDVVVEAQLVGGRLGLASFGGQASSLDPLTGRAGH